MTARNQSSRARVKILAVIAVVVIVAAAAVVLVSGGKDGGSDDRNRDGRLQVLGNANNDDYLDQDDVEELERIIRENGTVQDHPLADANHDGAIDSDDVEIVKRMVDRESMPIYIVNGKSEIQCIDYPVTKFISIGTDTLSSVYAVGAMSKVSAVAGKNLSDKTFYGVYQSIPKIGSSASNIKLEDTTTVTNAKVIITTPHKSTFSNQSAFDAAGYTTIRLPLTDTEEMPSGVLTLGYITQCEEQSQRLAGFYDRVLSEISGKTSGLSDSDRMKVLCIMGSDSACGMQDTRYKATVLAGADNVLKEDFGTKNIEDGSEWINNYNSARMIVHVTTSMTYSDTDLPALYDKLEGCVSQMDAAIGGHYYLISGSIAPIIRVAYMAGLFYPDLFGESYGDQIHQEYIDAFLSGLKDAGYRAESGTFVYSK